MVILSHKARKMPFTGCFSYRALVITRRQSREKVTRLSGFGAITCDKPYIIRKADNHHTMNDLYTTVPTQIVMYTTEYCSDCLRAKKFFEANNIPHLRVGLEGNRAATEFVMQVNHGYRSVPTIVFPDGSILVEPNWEELRAKFSNS